MQRLRSALISWCTLSFNARLNCLDTSPRGCSKQNSQPSSFVKCGVQLHFARSERIAADRKKDDCMSIRIFHSKARCEASAERIRSTGAISPLRLKKYPPYIKLSL